MNLQCAPRAISILQQHFALNNAPKIFCKKAELGLYCYVRTLIRLTWGKGRWNNPIVEPLPPHPVPLNPPRIFVKVI